jgi:hypothetical protein
VTFSLFSSSSSPWFLEYLFSLKFHPALDESMWFCDFTISVLVRPAIPQYYFCKHGTLVSKTVPGSLSTRGKGKETMKAVTLSVKMDIV